MDLNGSEWFIDVHSASFIFGKIQWETGESKLSICQAMALFSEGLPSSGPCHQLGIAWLWMVWVAHKNQLDMRQDS